MASLIGNVRSNGRIQFTKEDNPWVFKNIERSKTPISRIKVLPEQQSVTINLPEPGSAADFDWVPQIVSAVNTADAVFLNHKDGALRFGSAMHNLNKSRKVYTIGTLQEASKFSDERWKRVRYFYALKYDEFRFYITKMMTHKKGKVVEGADYEMGLRIEPMGNVEGESRMPCFDATGSLATNEIVEWRNTVSLGSIGRFDIDDRSVNLMIEKIVGPFCFLEEFREEFNNYSYEFQWEKIEKPFNRLIKKKLKKMEAEKAADSDEFL